MTGLLLSGRIHYCAESNVGWIWSLQVALIGIIIFDPIWIWVSSDMGKECRRDDEGLSRRRNGRVWCGHELGRRSNRA